MTWEDFYNRFYGWADSTQASRISQLTSFGSHEQVAEIILSYFDDKAASRLARKALDAGVRFTPDEIVEMQDSVSRECLNRMVTTALGDFTERQAEDLVLSVDDDIYANLEKRYCHYDDEEGAADGDEEGAADEPEPEDTPRQKKHSKLSGLFAFAGMASESGSRKKSLRFRIGDHVRVRWRGQEGTIIDINGGLYMVSMDDGRTVDSFPESDLEKAW